MNDNNLSRRNFIKAASTGAVGLSFSESRAQKSYAMSKAKELIVYIGTYTTGKSRGIYTGRLNLDSGALALHGSTEGVVNPSYLAIDQQNRYLYAVNETAEFQGKQGGAVSAFYINPKTYELQFLNQQFSHGAGPCYVSLDRTGGHVFVANYVGGNLAVFPVQNDGRLGEASDVIQHQGSSINPQSQKSPHAHSIVLDHANNYAVAADLGIDKLMIYRFDKRRGKLGPHDPPSVQIKPGSGPRHFIFHHNRRHAYVINELASTVTALTYEPKTGTLKEVQTVSALPADFNGVNYSADLHLSPAGKFLYGSNRGHNSIVVFAVNEKAGELTAIQHQPTQGKTPRNFGLDPTGKFLLAANQESDTIVSFKVDRQTGKLLPFEQMADVPTPVCVKFLVP